MAQQLVKVCIKIDASEWHGHANESIWAEPVSGRSLLFRVANSPFFARGISHNDVVKALPTEDGLVFDFDRVVERSGHSTYMILAESDGSRFWTCWDALERKGCSYESTHIDLSVGRRLLLSVDVPSSADVREVYDLLERGEADQVWLFQEGYAYLA
ncbi:DUF4265 domain-containing protein [Enhydrobacter aerosaccus]|uniref:DUF4265 domain-containing protein n=1 Tax=Enhydrobacter aerosaccus TaxID=225324 RepID=UPI000A2F60EB|nr:DUF4265 domain-containing protein [Enhydrobacter aerosaccus]